MVRGALQLIHVEVKTTIGLSDKCHISLRELMFARVRRRVRGRKGRREEGRKGGRKEGRQAGRQIGDLATGVPCSPALLRRRREKLTSSRPSAKFRNQEPCTL
jgi:hypothetical protein